MRARAGAYAMALERERGAEDISGPGGPRKSLKRLNSDKEIQGQPSRFLGNVFARAWPDLAEFGSAWIALGLQFQHADIHANSRRTQQLTL